MLTKYTKTSELVEQALDPFDRSVIETARNILLSLIDRGLTAQDFLNYFDEVEFFGAIKSEKALENYWQQFGMWCPRCPSWLQYIPIDIPQGRGNENGWVGRWYCINCSYEQLTKRRLEDGSR